MRCLTMALCLWLIFVANAAHAGEYQNLRPGPPVLELGAFFASTFPEALPQLPAGTVVAHFPCPVPATFVFADRSLRTYSLPSEAKVVATELRRDDGGAYYQLLYLLSNKQASYAERFAYPIWLNSDPVYVPNNTKLLVLERGPEQATVVTSAPVTATPQQQGEAIKTTPVVRNTPVSSAPSTGRVEGEHIIHHPFIRGQLDLRTEFLGVKPENIFTHQVIPSLWLNQHLGLTGRWERHEAKDLDPSQGWGVGLCYRTAPIHRLSVEYARLTFGEMSSSGQSIQLVHFESRLQTWFLHHELEAEQRDNDAKEVWTRLRSGLAFQVGYRSRLQMGGELANLNYELVAQDGYYYVSALGTRFNRSHYGAFASLDTHLGDHFPLRLLVGGGKGSVPEWNYINAELRLGVDF